MDQKVPELLSVLFQDGLPKYFAVLLQQQVVVFLHPPNYQQLDPPEDVLLVGAPELSCNCLPKGLLLGLGLPILLQKLLPLLLRELAEI